MTGIDEGRRRRKGRRDEDTQSLCLSGDAFGPPPKKGEKETIKTKQNEGNFLCKDVHVSKWLLSDRHF